MGTEDMMSLLNLKKVINILKTNEKSRKVVIHCAAGQHRTGLTMYLILREMGYNKDDALEAIDRVRPITYKEMIKVRRPNTWFQSANIKTLVDFAESYIKYNNKK